MEAQVRIATPAEAARVAQILGDAAAWLERRGIALWSAEQVSVAAVTPDVEAGHYYLAWLGTEAVGTMRLASTDPDFWPEAAPGEALYLHRLAVLRVVAGGQVSARLLRFAADQAAASGARYLRLDCETSRRRLRDVYERFGFAYHSERTVRRAVVARYQLLCTRAGGSGDD